MLIPPRVRDYPFLAILIVSLSAGWVSAESLRMPQIFGDHMVLQRDLPVVVWGWAAPRREVTVSFAGQVLTTRADNAGQWRVQLKPLSASKVGDEMLVRAGNEVADFNDVLVGEVWLCSGQSNMQWTLKNTDKAEEVIAASDFPLIRHIQANRVTSPIPLDDVKLEHPWERCTPKTASYFTAVGYYMARRLQEALDVPIGLVNSSWGGSNIESFTALEGFKAVPELSYIVQRVESSLPDHPSYEKQVRDILGQTKNWIKEAEAALSQNQRVPNAPALPQAVQALTRSQDPTVKYNAMIRGLAPYRIRGVIWYQGETNHKEGMLYVKKTEAKLASWRAIWGQSNLPYYYVQIAPYQYGQEDPHILATFWEAQAAIEKGIPHTHMVVINDVGDIKDIHPRDKDTVGSRLAASAMVHTYRHGGVAGGPVFDKMTIEGQDVHVRFKRIGGGLQTRDGNEPDWFEVAGENGMFVPAQATIKGNTVVLSSKEVKKPRAMRYAWSKLAEPNLQNREGFPAGAFRAGRISERALVDAKVPAARDFKLVYSYDVGAAGSNKKNVPYRVNHSKDTRDFDRVGYFLVLQKANKPLQWVWVTCDPFTDQTGQLGIPVSSTKTKLSQWVENMAVQTNVEGVKIGKGFKGYIEFWPHNYSKENSNKVAGASDSAYDFGDTPRNPVEGYGCLQIHHPAAQQTVLAVNNWASLDKADVGIGNSPEGEPDYTFRGNAGQYRVKRLMVLVREND